MWYWPAARLELDRSGGQSGDCRGDCDRTWSLFRQSLHLLFDGVPEHVDLPTARQYLLEQQGVCDVNDLHVWAMSTAEVALIAHINMHPLPQDDVFLQVVAHELHEHFGIGHATLQLERDFGCPLGCARSAAT